MWYYFQIPIYRRRREWWRQIPRLLRRRDEGLQEHNDGRGSVQVGEVFRTPMVVQLDSELEIETLCVKLIGSCSYNRTHLLLPL